MKGTRHKINFIIEPKENRISFAVRKENGEFLLTDGKFDIPEHWEHVDMRSSPGHWEKYNVPLDGGKVVMVTAVLTVTLTEIE